jgi:hypothetical protein
VRQEQLIEQAVKCLIALSEPEIDEQRVDLDEFARPRARLAPFARRFA